VTAGRRELKPDRRSDIDNQQRQPIVAAPVIFAVARPKNAPPHIFPAARLTIQPSPT
jgi:hypothetical protein